MNNYFYIDQNGNQNGPVAGETLKSCGVTQDTLVWCDGMANWAKAGDVVELASLFASVPPVYQAPPVAPVQPNVQPNVQHNQYYSKPEGVCPDNYLVWSILVTILCCWPFGIPAIVNSTKVEKLWMMGDMAGAKERAAAAKKWCWVSFGCAIAVWVLYFIFVVLVGVEAASVSDYYYY
jgi:hypothetical protein